MWVKDSDLRQTDRDVIVANAGMLNDKHMHAVHKLLHMQFPHLEGCHSTLLVQLRSFPPVTTTKCTGIFIMKESIM